MKKQIALILIVMLLGIALAPAVNGMTYKTYKLANGRYVSIESYSGSSCYIEVWDRYRPGYSHYSDSLKETFSGKSANQQLVASKLWGCISAIKLVQTASGPCAMLTFVPYVGPVLAPTCLVGFGAYAINKCYNAAMTISIPWK